MYSDEMFAAVLFVCDCGCSACDIHQSCDSSRCFKCHSVTDLSSL